MASSRLQQLCSSSVPRPSCHGEKFNSNVGSRNPLTLRKNVEFLSQRVFGYTRISTTTTSSSSSRAAVESQFLQCHGGSSDGEPELGSRNPIAIRKEAEFLPQRFGRQIKVPNARAPSSSESRLLHCHGGRSDDGEAEFSRREVGVASMAFILLVLWGDGVAVAGGFDKYLKKKKLDPLDSYVPTVLLAQSQFQEVDGKLDANGEEKKFADARSLLRTGPAASLRTVIRAVAQYAAETGSDDGPVASAAVDECLSALEDLDSLLFQASRSQGAPVERMRQDLTMTVAALDKLLATVPTPILEKSRAIAEAYKEASY